MFSAEHRAQVGAARVRQHFALRCEVQPMGNDSSSACFYVFEEGNNFPVALVSVKQELGWGCLAPL